MGLFLQLSVLGVVVAVAVYAFAGGKKKKRGGDSGPGKSKPQFGVLFPETDRGDRSTSFGGKRAFAAAVGAVDPAAAEKVKKEKNWRFGYTKHIIRNVQESLRSPQAAIKIARSGLDYVHASFEFATQDGSIMPISEAMRSIKGSFETIIIKGDKPLGETSLKVPYWPFSSKSKRDQSTLEGDALRAKLAEWVSRGTIEDSARTAIERVVDRDGALDLSDEYFVLLGASSAMGPLELLLSYGANVIAVDLDREGIWKKLISAVRNSPGTMIIPMKKSPSECKTDDEVAANAGCNLLTQPAEISNWLKSLCPNERLIIGGYAYLDGELHVKVAVAMDAIMESVCEARKDTMLAFLCTPTDCHVMTKEAHTAAIENFKKAPWWMRLISSVSGGKYLERNVMDPVRGEDGEDAYFCDGLVVAQGPNYALAKRIQTWRTVVARADGHAVSTNVAPSTATLSVMHNKMFAAAYHGMDLFVPMEVFRQETSTSVMGALLIHDVLFHDGVAYPSTPLRNPLCVVREESMNGGVWRCGFKIGSIGHVAVMAYYAKSLFGMA
eukprot:TRINITY_DN82173_c0_g1_i1.p1 TRINITY_DN82173_c0_g1~~TRINITY_DN82173_c0_g1_i1.p1  ORF type:complete len:553 (+),score=166.48 TRINITY_DN82173_c0_g1_i1:185-1843(+)